MPHYASNMPPTATAGAYSGMGMPSYGMQANAQISPNVYANIPPTYTSPAYISPAEYPPMGYGPMPYGPMPVPVYAAVASCGGGTSAGIILVLFILLVIIGRALH
jgi:hypothetical protein